MQNHLTVCVCAMSLSSEPESSVLLSTGFLPSVPLRVGVAEPTQPPPPTSLVREPFPAASGGGAAGSFPPCSTLAAPVPKGTGAAVQPHHPRRHERHQRRGPLRFPQIPEQSVHEVFHLPEGRSGRGHVDFDCDRGRFLK